MNNDNVIDAELIEETQARVTGRPSVVEIPKRTAEAMDAVADTVAHFSPEGAQRLRGKAQVVRDIGRSAEAVTEASTHLVGAVAQAKDKLQKLGIKFGFKMENRVGNPRGTPRPPRAPR